MVFTSDQIRGITLATITANTIPGMYREVAQKFGNQPAFGTKRSKGVFETISYSELYEKGLDLATALLKLGIKPGSKIAVLSENRLEWIFSDYGIQIAGCANVPRGTDVTDGDIQYILPHSDSVAVFVENEQTLEKIKKNKKYLKNIKHKILMDPSQKAPRGVIHLYDLIEEGNALRKKGDNRAVESLESVKPEDLFTLIYTSGTTGVPKGVMLEQRHIISQVRLLPVRLFPNDRALSILTIWHIFERMIEMACIGNGVCTYYTNPRNIKDDMMTVKPTIMASAPRLWEMVYQGIIKKVESGPGLNKKLFEIAYNVSGKFNLARRILTFREIRLKPINPLFTPVQIILSLIAFVLLYLPNFLLDAVVLSKIRAATGGKIRFTISGGGALPPHIDRFFNNIGLKVLEGYGLTETSPVLAVRLPDQLVIGTVGPIWPETEVRLVDIQSGEIIYPSKKGAKGEIHVRGSQVMRGYYKNSEATDKVMKDGWFNTGDLGVITFNNCLKIVGRSKETIVLTGGENVEPTPIETKILESDFIDQVMVTGQDKKYLTALVVPSIEALSEYGTTLDEILKSENALQMVRDDIKKKVNQESGFKSFERIIDVRLLSKSFEVGDEMTNTYKVKRDIVAEKYSDLIESMY